MYWIVDESLNERLHETGFPTLFDAAREAGHTAISTKYRPFEDDKVFSEVDFPNKGKCVIVHGTVEFCKKFERVWGKHYTPGLYFNQNVKHWSKFAPYIGADLLNSDYSILPYAEAKRRHVPQEAMFIKPESGLKEFTGQTVNYPEDFDKLSPYGKIDPSTLCVVAAAKDIKAEFRYVIANRKVITGSEYRWDNKLDVRIDTHPACYELAKKVAEADWQADSVYICDVALTGSMRYPIAKVIELNAFSSSGLYACDTRKVVEAVSSAAMKEWSGELEDV